MEEREEEREKKQAEDLQPAIAQTPKGFVRVKGGSYVDKVVLSNSNYYMCCLLHWLQMTWQHVIASTSLYS